MIFYTLYRYRPSSSIDCFYSEFGSRRTYLDTLALWNRQTVRYAEVPTRCVEKVFGSDKPSINRNRKWPLRWPVHK